MHDPMVVLFEVHAPIPVRTWKVWVSGALERLDMVRCRRIEWRYLEEADRG